MKPASFKEIETYIYTSIVLPLKGLAVQELRYPSPLMGEDGLVWELRTILTPVRIHYRRNYQRTQAERRRNYWIILKIADGRRFVLGEYHIKYHTVKLYQQAFSELNAIPLMGKMLDVFQTNSPFTKITVESGEYPEYEPGGGVPSRGLRRRLTEEPPFDDDGYYDETDDDIAMEAPF